jgi:hypothetical protein
VYKCGWLLSVGSKMQVRGDFYAHRGVDQSNFLDTTL